MNLLLIVISIILFAMAFMLIDVFIKNKERQAQLNEQQTKLVENERLLKHTILIQEAEKERIAKDLHNKVGSKLNILHLYLHRLTKKGPNRNIDIIKEVLNETIDTSSRMSQQLLPSALEYFGLVSAIDELCDQFQQTNQIAVYFESDDKNTLEISKLVTVQIFRIVQELMNNTLKYPQTNQIRISLWQNGEKLLLFYKDNGYSFDLSSLEKEGAIWIKSIESRLQMINGTSHLKTAIGEGIEIRIEVNNVFSK